MKMEENKPYAYSSQTCMKCNSIFVYYDGWHCNCETTESSQKIIQDLTAELEEYRSIAEKIGAEKAVSDKAKWEELADKLIAYAEEVKCVTSCQALLEAACQDIEEYRKLKETANGTV